MSETETTEDLRDEVRRLTAEVEALRHRLLMVRVALADDPDEGGQ